MKKRFIFLALGTALFVILGLTACREKKSAESPEARQIIIRYASTDAEGTAHVQGQYAFEKYVEEKSNGILQVECYIDGALGSDRQAMESLQLGNIEMAMVLGNGLAQYDPALSIISMPYLFNSQEAMWAAVDGEWGTKVKEKLAKVNFHGLGFCDGGIYEIFTNVRPIDTLKAIAGQKLRVPQAEVDIAYFTALGATPTPLSFGELFTALEQKTVDGLDMSAEIAMASSLMEPVKYLTLDGHCPSIFPVLVSPKFWGTLTAEQQAILEGGIKEQVAVNRRLAPELRQKALNTFKEMGGEVIELSPAAMADFQAAGEKVQKEFAAKVGQDMIDLAKSYNK
jgi:tripartite ATP-independent transporter DctP family solute receptor